MGMCVGSQQIRKTGLRDNLLQITQLGNVSGKLGRPNTKDCISRYHTLECDFSFPYISTCWKQENISKGFISFYLSERGMFVYASQSVCRGQTTASRSQCSPSAGGTELGF